MNFDEEFYVVADGFADGGEFLDSDAFSFDGDE